MKQSMVLQMMSWDMWGPERERYISLFIHLFLKKKITMMSSLFLKASAGSLGLLRADGMSSCCHSQSS